jgi:hypothetical protein
MATRERNAQEMLSRVERDPRRRFGWGPSALASPEEKAAYEFIEKEPLVMSGQMSPAALPEEYGGRPTGSTRRSMRMQAAWDAQYKSELERQKEIRDAERFNLEIAREQRFRDQEDREFAKQKLLSDRENAIQQEARLIQDSIIGGQQIGVDKEGNPVFSKPINVRDVDAVENLQRLSKNRLGMKDQAAYDMWKTALDDAREYREEMENETAENMKAETSAKVSLAKDLGAYGMSISDFTKDGKIDFVAANEAIGRRYSEAGKEKEAKAEAKEEMENIGDKITSAENELLKVRARAEAARTRLEARPTNTNFKTEFEAATIEQGILEDEINRLNRIRGGEPAPQTQQGTTGQRPPLSDIFGGSR